jgi:heme oxygenase
MSKSALLRQERWETQDGFTLRDRLKQATRKEHEALESGLDLLRVGFGLTEYRELLVRYHGFYVSFESFLLEQAKQGSAPAMFYREARCKADWLVADLKSLGIFHCSGEAAQYSADLRLLFPCASHQLGAVYVLEGSMLGGRVLSRHFGESLGLTAQHGLRFFSGYGASMASMWNGMLQLLESDVPATLSHEEVIAGARSMFSLLSRQLGVTQA